MGDNRRDTRASSPSTFDPVQLLKQLRGEDAGYSERGDINGSTEVESMGGNFDSGTRNVSRSPEGTNNGGWVQDTQQRGYKGESANTSVRANANGRVHAQHHHVPNKVAHDTHQTRNKGHESAKGNTPPSAPIMYPKPESHTKWNSSASGDSGMIALLQRQVAEKVSENNKLFKALEEAHHTIALLREENKALENALALHSQAPLPPTFPHPTHPSELTLLRDRVAYLESALESALEATSGELGPDWNLGELDLESPPSPTSHTPPYSHASAPLSPPHHSTSYPPYHNPYHTPEYPMPSSVHPQASTIHPQPTNGISHNKPNTQLQHYPTSQHTKNGPSTSNPKELDKRPPFISAISPHSSRFAKPGETAKLQIPKAPPDVGKPVIRIDLSSEITKTQQPKIPKKKSAYNARTLPVSISPVTIPNYPNT